MPTATGQRCDGKVCVCMATGHRCYAKVMESVPPSPLSRLHGLLLVCLMDKRNRMAFQPVFWIFAICPILVFSFFPGFNEEFRSGNLSSDCVDA